MLVCASLLAACNAPPRPDEADILAHAIKPPQQAAEKATKEYADIILNDGPSGRYKFRSLTRGYLLSLGVREFGWFLCGQVNAKNKMGGYTGYQAFIMHFTPKAPFTVDSGFFAEQFPDSDLVDTMCTEMYSTGKVTVP